jgi:hypothetical protein
MCQSSRWLSKNKGRNAIIRFEALILRYKSRVAHLWSPSNPYQACLVVEMAERMAFLLFGDQSLNIHECLADFYRRENAGALCNSFLERAATVLRDEVDRLSNVERLRIPTFSTIQDLNDRYNSQGQKNSALDSALVCITQLLLYIE